MKINPNDEQQFTLENVRRLIASKNDSQHRQLRVTQQGIAYLSDVVGSQGRESLAFRLEAYCQGNGYTGAAAAKDDKWVTKVFRALRANWPQPRSSYIEIY